VAGCGNSGTPDAPRNTAGTDPQKNASAATQFFRAVASNDPDQVAAAYGLAAPLSPAMSYLQLLHEGLTQTGIADTVSVNNGRYKVCRAGSPKICHTYSAIVLSDGKVNDFTIDGKKIRLR
jgi:hypothetical protein